MSFRKELKVAGARKVVNVSAEVIANASSKVINGMTDSDGWSSSYARGDRQKNDILLFREDVSADYQFLRSVYKEIPYSGYQVITDIKITDMWRDGTGGYCKIMSGGVGHKYVTIGMKGQYGKPSRMVIGQLIAEGVTTLAVHLVTTNVFTSEDGWTSCYAYGNLESTDKLLFTEDVKADFAFMQTVRRDIPYCGTKKITGIVVKDMWGDGTGGYCKILSGGVGKKHVTIGVKSQYGRGFRFFIEIYGR